MGTICQRAETNNLHLFVDVVINSAAQLMKHFTIETRKQGGAWDLL